MERGVEIVMMIVAFIIGASHVLQPRAWVAFFVALRARGEAGVLVDGFLYLPMAALIVGFHGSVWSGIPAVVTVLGWGYLIKSILRFCWPQQGLKMMQRISLERAWEFQVPGVIYLILAGLIAFSLLR